ncbi:MAG TPA: hypothetical protein VLY04_10685 [Bryobacteraceae bacterium]|nr:hypothetical protein [Bryobacteraceae bacterium]
MAATERESARLKTRQGMLAGYRFFAAVAAYFACAMACRADIIDRIAVSVGNQVVTASDLDREISVVAFLNRAKPDFSPAGKHATAERMVEQKLIRRELENSRYPVPSAAEAEPLLQKFRQENFPNDDEFRRALAEYGISEQDLKDELLWQRTLLLFLDVRFRPGIQVTEQEIQDYFTKVVEPAAKAAHPSQPVTLADFRDQIEETLAGEKENEQVDAWLKQARARAEVVYHEEAFR